MVKNVWILAVAMAVGSLLLPAAAIADIVVEPDAFAVGTNISNAFPGVTLSAVGPGWSNPSGAVFSVDPTIYPYPFNASTGALVFGSDDGLHPQRWREDGWLQLRADFASPANSVSLDFIGDNASDFGELHAYDSGGTLVDSAYTGQLTANMVETLTVSSASFNIAYIVAGGVDSVSALGLDNLHFQPIPAPGAALLGVIGLGLVGWAKRRFS